MGKKRIVKTGDDAEKSVAKPKASAKKRIELNK